MFMNQNCQDESIITGSAVISLQSVCDNDPGACACVETERSSSNRLKPQSIPELHKVKITKNRALNTQLGSLLEGGRIDITMSDALGKKLTRLKPMGDLRSEVAPARPETVQTFSLPREMARLFFSGRANVISVREPARLEAERHLIICSLACYMLQSIRFFFIRGHTCNNLSALL